MPYSFGVNSGPLKSQVVDEAGNPITGNACATERRGSQMFTDASPIGAKVTRANSIKYNEDGYSGTFAVTCPVTPPAALLTKNSALLNSTIDDLEAVGHSRADRAAMGCLHAFAELEFGLANPSHAAAYGTKDLDKFLILMTDGMFQFGSVGSLGCFHPDLSGDLATLGRLAMTYCNEIKTKKVKLFTIGFRLQDIGNSSQRTEASGSCRTALQRGGWRDNFLQCRKRRGTDRRVQGDCQAGRAGDIDQLTASLHANERPPTL